MARALPKYALLFGLYLLLAGQVSTHELGAAALCSLAATAISASIPRIARRHFAFAGVPWLRLSAAVARSLAADTLRVGSRLARPHLPGGALQRVAFAAGGAGDRATAHRALATLAASAAPNGYVVGVLRGRGELLLHRLAAANPPTDTDWPV